MNLEEKHAQLLMLRAGDMLDEPRKELQELRTMRNLRSAAGRLRQKKAGNWMEIEMNILTMADNGQGVAQEVVGTGVRCRAQ